MGCDYLRKRNTALQEISIRAPVWGAMIQAVITKLNFGSFQSAHPCGVRCVACFVLCALHSISIRAPVWGAIHVLLALYWYRLHFNPRTRVGCDGSSDDDIYHLIKISIRAPVWGAISANVCTISNTSYFNPRTRVGCDGRTQI